MKEDLERKCIVTGEAKNKDELLRFTITPEGIVVPDFRKKLPGKGVYVSNSKECLVTAVKKSLFTKAFKKNAKAGLELIDTVEAVLAKTGLESINLARKAGELVTGFDKVTEAIKKGKAAFLLEAKDSLNDGHKKILSLAGGLEIFMLYDVEELDKALDKANTVHAAFLKSEVAKKVYLDFKRLENFSKKMENVE